MNSILLCRTKSTSFSSCEAQSITLSATFTRDSMERSEMNGGMWK